MTLSARKIPSAILAIVLLAALFGAGQATARETTPAGGTLKGITVQPDGRMLRITFQAAAPIMEYTLSRQGPPEKRDLVVRLPGFISQTPATIDTGDYILPIDVVREEEPGSQGVKVTLGMVGDNLIRVVHQGSDLGVFVIAPEKRSDAANTYLIGANDMLQVDVFGHEDLNKTLKVSPRGLINFPLIGNVRAEGHTVDDVAADITERLAADFLKDPHVTVSVWEYLSQWVNVIGEVARPGRYYLTGATTLVDALSQAGGLAPGAGKEILVSRRAEEVDPAAAGEVFHVDLKALFSAEGTHLNMRLRSGDIINVLGRETAQKAP
ncbi:MAG TPA: polysaccharide biosynthesis/export family protein [Candidatus Polarisedimenticolia bacterium]|nr:polysaccharide biosynthesis/export family protein [Candidatus Polarisedimenticolia bacterium]